MLEIFLQDSVVCYVMQFYCGLPQSRQSKGCSSCVKPGGNLVYQESFDRWSKCCRFSSVLGCCCFGDSYSIEPVKYLLRLFYEVFVLETRPKLE